MRPIKLKIKGLNSFIEEQTIDFNKLTSRGLFGIFGPTGSGKSTILDGITLALYGEVSRKSTNFINTNMDSCNVSFEFSISAASSITKLYRVEREFKIDKKTGNPRSGKCKITDITNENDTVVLADKVTEVTSKCEEIIGLTLDDFTRTVVLPQGKFSEFLKLEGKPRRDMLERLFNLQKYGDNLSFKLSREILKNKQLDSYLDGILSGSENINEENYTLLKDELDKTTSSYNESNTQAEAINKKYEEDQNIWNLQNELNKYNASKSELLIKNDEMVANGKRIERAEAVFRVLPYYQSYRKTVEAIKATSEQLTSSKNNLELIKEEKQATELKYTNMKQLREQELPQLTLKLEKAKDCITLQQNLNQHIKDINIAKTELDNTILKVNNDKNTIAKLIKSIESAGQAIEKLDNDASILKVDSLYKSKVLNGLDYQKDLVKAKKDIDDKELKLNKLVSDISANEQRLSNLKNECSKLNKDKSDTEALLSKLKNNAPVKTNYDISSIQNEIINKQQQVNEHSKTWSTFTRLSDEINNQKAISSECIDRITALENQQNKLEAVVNDTKQQIEIKNKDALVYELRKTIHENDVCPVCGSPIHDLEHLHSTNNKALDRDDALNTVTNTLNNNDKGDICDTSDSTSSREIDVLNEELKTYESLLINTIRSLSACKSRLQDSQNIISNNNKQISELDEKHLAVSIDDMNNNYSNLKTAIECYIQEYDALTKKIEVIDRELSNKLVELKGINENAINQTNERNALLTERKSIIEIYNQNLEIFNSLVAETSINNFAVEYEHICSKETKREAILSKISTDRNNLAILNKKHNDMLNELNLHQQSEAKLNTEINQKNEAINNIREEISDKIGTVENIDLYINQLNEKINKLNNDFNSTEIYKDSFINKYDKANEMFIQLQSKLNELRSNKEQYTEALNNSLKDDGFENIDQLKASYIERTPLNELISSLDAYKNSLAKLDGMIEAVKNNLAGKCITEQEWNNTREEKLQNDKKLSELNDRKIQLASELNSFKKKLDEIKETLIKKEKLAHKLGLLADLDKLFKGKKFVEYAALERLKYISREADKKLKEISSGSYGLEADENGKFIIRDYKNGGAKRDASTLSGGETFITSLALALSLSAEIQLKGTAPLELFFLDEGFGTLDDELLEVVMSSLEEIHNDKLKIGIISHVESIKNRVPVKLLLTPAESGMGGSKVKLDY